MLSLLISLIIGTLASVISTIWLTSQGWIITIGSLVFIVGAVLMNRFFGKKLAKLVEEVQGLLGESQQNAVRVMNRFQSKPMGSQKLMQTQIEKVVEKGVLEALELMENAKPLYNWSLLSERQVNTLKMQLNFQIKRFDEVDRLIPSVLVLEPLILAMKMTRQYHLNSPDLEKTFKKGVKKFKYEKAILIYGLYSWILVKRKEIDKALEVLTEAKEKTDDETIKRNWQNVANNKIHLFSNAGLGEQWYTLHLDKPPKQKASKGQMKSNPLMPKRNRKQF